ncbi:MAG TPA: hypothetical protein VFB14_07145 [Bryobacteraceae bacterium]|nr:hypothetical protein [Bryobacteraceae bacterium]
MIWTEVLGVSKREQIKHNETVASQFGVRHCAKESESLVIEKHFWYKDGIELGNFYSRAPFDRAQVPNFLCSRMTTASEIVANCLNQG